MIALAAGLLAGSIHALSGPDHLAAVSPLALAHPKRATAVGLSWGLGHGLGVAALGLLALLFTRALPLETLSSFGDVLAGGALILIGLFGLRRASSALVREDEHAHAGVVHTHARLHGGADRAHTHAALAVGFLHGVAGTPHLIGLLPALALRSDAAFLYIGGFTAGAAFALTTFAAALGVAAERAAGKKQWQLNFVRAASLASIAVGCAWLTF